MGARFPNPRLVKIHRSYTFDEAARTLGVHKNTIRNWQRKGLRPMEGCWPLLLHGPELRRFLEEARSKSKQSCPPGHFYCVRCRAPRRPSGRSVTYVAATEFAGSLHGICEACGCRMRRRTSKEKLAHMRAIFDIKTE
jgi:hypothetical protein